MTTRHLLVLMMFLAAAACTDDTAGGVAQFNNTSMDTGGQDMAPDATPDQGQSLGEVGDACTFGTECESGICINGACAEACTGDADCPLGFSCIELEVDLEGGGSETVSACVADTPCTANSDCSDPDVCVVDRAGAAIDLTCDAPAGPGDVGGTCTMDSDCESGLCIDGACSAPCDTSNDCAADGSFVCEITSVATGTGGSEDLTICVPRPPDSCISDADCTGTDRCVANKTMTELQFECGPAVGTEESGDACVVDADCAQNLCIGGACAGPCAEVGDCGGAPQRCEVTNVNLGNNAMASAQICVPPISCGNQGDCPVAAGDVCYVREDAGAIDPICRAANVGGGGLGQVCSAATECANNFCLDTRFRDVCVFPCLTNADCTTVGYECGTVAVPLTAGGTEDVSMCVPKAPPACASESACGTGLDCAIIANVAGDALESVCVPTTGGVATGVACTTDDDCGSLVCLNSFCAAPCTDTTQCGTNQICLSQTVTKAPNSGSFNVCTTLPETVCTSTDDCTDGTRVCGQLRNNAGTGMQEAICRFPNAGGQQLGTTCTQGNQCRENICLAALSAECTVVCDKDADCGTAQGCTTFGDLNFCNTVCSDNTDCGAPNRYCTINGDVLTNEVDQVCTLPVGASDLGAICVNGGECLTGLCLRTLTYNGTGCTADTDCAGFANHTCECPINDANCTVGKECAAAERRCTNLCDDSGDCAGGVAANPMTSCNSDIFVTRPNGGSANIAACSRP